MNKFTESCAKRVQHTGETFAKVLRGKALVEEPSATLYIYIYLHMCVQICANQFEISLPHKEEGVYY